MARKNKTEIIFHNSLYNKISFGESKHRDKQELGFGKSNYKIYSFTTFNTYDKESKQYAKWIAENKGITKIKNIDETEQYAKEYLQSRIDSGVSIWTVKLERSMLGMLYGKEIEIDIPVRDNKDITRSRKDDNEYKKHISRTGKHKDIFVIASATGTRRKDISKLTVNNFVEKDGRLYVKFIQSKGGRDRLAPVLPSMQLEVKEIITKAKLEGRNKLFDKIPQKIDIHGLRREYAQNIYKFFVEDKEFRDTYLDFSGVPKRHEIKTFKDKDGNTQFREIKRTFYKDRDNNIYDRTDLYALTQALGHNRLSVSLIYLK